ncbi:MAG: protein-L-isoaspartate(D-aspartate) O-methyltransferase [Fervidicoccaceae archaeon]
MGTQLISFYERRKSLVERLRAEGILKSEKVERAFLRVPREKFVPPEYREYAYFDEPLPIGLGQTISAPHMVAIMTEELNAEAGWRVLEIGTGSGYQAAILAEIVAPSDERREKWGHVFTIERLEMLAEQARKNIASSGYEDRITVIVGDGSLGYEKEAPYDGILVSAAAPKIPRPLIEQLKDGGRMVIPVGHRYVQRLHVVEKTGESIRVNVREPCVFVPLIGKEGFSE